MPHDSQRDRPPIGVETSAGLRRGWVIALSLSLMAIGLNGGPSFAPAQNRLLAVIDQRIGAVLQKWKVPGATVAIAREGRLLYAAGYGMADVEAAQAMRPETLMRIASVSKPLTAVGTLRLVEEGRLDLDARAFALLDNLPLSPGASTDPRVDAITVRHLLQHSSGWQLRTLDPFLLTGNQIVAAAMDVTPPVDCATVIRFIRGRPLSFDPGSRLAYDNMNYCILGRIIERITGQTYGDYMQERVLRPSGIVRGRLGRTQLADRAEGEAKYHVPGPMVPSVFPAVNEKIPAPYGAFYLEAMDALGGWVMSVVDLLRFISALDGRRGPPLLRQETLAQIEAIPPPSFFQDVAAYQGLGFMVRRTPNATIWYHGGNLPGTAAQVVRIGGLSGAFITNGSPELAMTEKSSQLVTELEEALYGAEIKQWPTEDLFDRLP